MSMNQSHTIREAEEKDWVAIARIYNHYIKNSIATFEEIPVDGEEMGIRVKRSQDNKLPWLVYEEDKNSICGYAYAIPWKARAAYRHSLETSIYLSHEHLGKGIGKALYTELIRIIEEKDIHAVIGGVSLPNIASVALHERMGFAKVAQFREVGFKFGKWIDVGYWERILD